MPHPPPQRILWIGAHPDDEGLVAPLLGRSCIDETDRCSLLVMTRGEGGGDPAVRTGEMQRAADLFRAHLDLWDFGDVGVNVADTWSAQAGDHDALVERIAAEIVQENPTIIYTFDPNHGSTCHPAHRALGALVIEAIDRLRSAPPRVQFVETIVEFLPGDFLFQSAIPDAMIIDANATWRFLVEDAALHVSQFTAEQVEALRNIPAGERRVYLATVPARRYSCGR